MVIDNLLYILDLLDGKPSIVLINARLGIGVGRINLFSLVSQG